MPLDPMVSAASNAQHNTALRRLLGRHVDFHAAHDGSTGFNHMGGAPGGRRICAVVECVSAFRRSLVLLWITAR